MIFNRILPLIGFIWLIGTIQINAELTELHEDNWRLMLDGEWMVEL